jgi:histidinol-phosphatase (PHP family)
MVQAAISKGLRAFGLSEHCHTPVPIDSGHPTFEELAAFGDEVRTLKTKYADKIELFYGIEQDSIGDSSTDGTDYVIGSTHFVNIGGVYRFVDDGADGQRETVARFYGGDWYAFAEAYFADESQIVDITNCDIIGHFDLINKNNEGDRLFDTSHPRYRAAAIASMERILRRCNLFEVNTGAMYRVGRTEQYPQTWLLRELLTRGGEVILSSDSHDTASIGYKFDEMEDLLREVGFARRKTLTRGGWTDIEL